MDGSGDFELVSKRGPPRGPRGPRKDGGAPGGPAPAPVTLPHMGGLSSPGPRGGGALLPGGNGLPAAGAQMNGLMPTLHSNMAAVNMAAMVPSMWPVMPGLNGLQGAPPMLRVNALEGATVNGTQSDDAGSGSTGSGSEELKTPKLEPQEAPPPGAESPDDAMSGEGAGACRAEVTWGECCVAPQSSVHVWS